MQSLDMNIDDLEDDDCLWIVDEKRIPVYLMEAPDWNQFDSTRSQKIGRHVLYGILRSSQTICVLFTYTDPSFMRIDFGDGSLEFFNISLSELNGFVNEFVTFDYGVASGHKVDWKKEGF